MNDCLCRAKCKNKKCTNWENNWTNSLKREQGKSFALPSTAANYSNICRPLYFCYNLLPRSLLLISWFPSNSLATAGWRKFREGRPRWWLSVLLLRNYDTRMKFLQLRMRSWRWMIVLHFDISTNLVHPHPCLIFTVADTFDDDCRHTPQGSRKG